MGALLTATQALNTAQGFVALAPSIIQMVGLLQGLFGHKRGNGPDLKNIVMSTIPPEHQAASSALVDTVAAVAKAAQMSQPQ